MSTAATEETTSPALVATCYLGHGVAAGDVFCGHCGAPLQGTADASGHDLEASGLTVVRGGQTILDDVSLVVPPRSLVAVLGPSGAGKTTLVGALTGTSPADRGVVSYAGHDLCAEYDAVRHVIGVVPQQDLLHESLTVAAALDFGARLRLPRSVTASQRAERISQVLQMLDLTERSHLRIDRLSGGQRKRTSVALELLTAPSLLFLDEPTSGLDPGLDRRVMAMARSLAHDENANRTVFVVTHSIMNLDQCDYLVIMAPGGRLAYFGPPQRAPQEFGVTTMSAVFDSMAGDPAETDHLVERTRRKQTHELLRRRPRRTVTPLAPSRGPGPLMQWWILTQRQLAVMVSDRRVSVMLLALPLVLGVLGAAIGTEYGIGQDPQGFNPHAPAVLLVLLISVILVGIANTIQQIAGETAVYRRERAMGLGRGSYVAAKFLVLGAVTVLQTAVILALALMDRPGPTDPPIGGAYAAVLLPLVTLALACVAIGLALSAYLQSRERTMNALVSAVILLIVLSGAWVLRFDSVAIEALQRAVPSSWSYDAMAAATDLDSLAPGPVAKARWSPTADSWYTGLIGTGLFIAIGLIGTWAFLGRMDPARRRGA